jgi:hypothetical protein
MKSSHLILPALLLLSLGCSHSQKNNAAETPPTTQPSVAPAVAEGPVSLKIVSPTQNEVVKTSDVPVTFDLKNYEVQPDGQHIHVILDNEPYQPCYSVKEPFLLKGVKPGIHTLRAFPARAWHESIKDPEAFASVTFYVEKKKGKAPVNFESDQILTYSRPKGKYEGEKANKILFDFWVKNSELSPNGNQVRYKLDNDDTKTLSEWKPTYFENLAAGKHKLVIDLVNKKGKPVKGKYNHTEREFEVQK